MSRSTIYIGSFVHSRSLVELEHVERAIIHVEADGTISWIEKDVSSTDLQDVALKHGVDLERGNVDIVELDQDEFFSPGFIDTHTVCCASSLLAD